MANKVTLTVLGFEHSSGISKQQRPYDFAKLNVLKKNDGWTQSANGQCTRIGLMQDQLDMCHTNQTLLTELAKLEGQFPLELECHIDLNPDNLQRNWVVDFKVIQQ
ncbi:hypothetical protein [Vibrio nigripulchritudo]|uniref:hypothetical protein n=1 Tax=Vibrio nigripulchritudo TaxID=28173 RepID=UPI00249235C7|nr:hypothetical protein [Vibrio nigripulchritudo]BDU45851.1 hypothetical protein TUMSATVNIG3_46490 [Vibrio nigripulchritudo]